MSASKSRRRAGDGSVTEYLLADGTTRWAIWWYEPIDPTDPGSHRRKRGKRGFASQDGAYRALRAKIADVDAGRTLTRTSEVSFGEYAAAWLTSKRVSPSTLAHYERYLRLHVLPHLGQVPLAKITPTMLSGHYANLQAGQLGRPPLGPNSVKKVHNVLHQVLEAAFDDGAVHRNVADHPRANPPTAREVREAKPQMTVWTPRQLAAFLTWAREHDPEYWPMWELYARTGMRRGEAIGLLWLNLEFAGPAPFISKRSSMVEVKAKGRQVERVPRLPKNGETHRIPVDQQVVTAMRIHRDRIGKTRGFAALGPDALVFSRPDGSPLRGDTVWDRFNSAQRRYNQTHPETPLPRIKVHEMRHTHATILLAGRENPRYVQDRLGHKSIAITMDIYSHVLSDAQAETAATFAGLLECAAAAGPEPESGSPLAW